MFSNVGLSELLAIGASLSYSVTLVSLRQGMRSASPLAAVLLIDSLVCTAGLTAALLRGTLQSSSLTFILFLALAGCFGPGLGNMANFIGIDRMGVSRAIPVSASTPIWGVLFATAILGERPGVPVWLGTLCIVGGVFVLSLGGKEEGRGFGSWFRGALIFPLVASLFLSIGPIFVKLGLSHQKTPMAGIGIAFAAGMTILLAGKPLLPGGGKIQADGRALRWFLLGGVFNIGASFMMFTALMVGEVSIALPLSRLMPLWVLLLSYLFLGQVERITGRVALAAALVVAGGVLITAFR